jgi:SulP family sulfate permease
MRRPALQALQPYLPFLSWMRLLDRGTARNDIVAGMTAGVLILPQAIALATLAGMPPEYGLYTAIFPVIIVCLFGSSRQSLAGPNTALAVLIAMTVAPFATIGSPEYVQYAITLTFMAGVLQLAMGVFRLGVVFNYFSHTVMVALVTGVGAIIVVQQIGNFMGVLMNPNEDLDDIILQIWYAIFRANPYAVFIGVLTVASGLLIRRYRRKWPHYILAVLIGTVAAKVIHLFVDASQTRIDMLGYMQFSALPLSAPDFSPERFAEFANFAYPAAIGMAVLGLMQSAVIARSLATKSGQEGLDINQEVVGQGLSNVAGSFLSCFASCASFNRSAANLEAGARTPLAGLVSAVALALLVFLAAPLIAWLPLPVMAAVLVLVGMALIKVQEIRQLLSTRGGNRIVFVLVLLTTLLGGVDDGVYLGIFLSITGYLRGMSRPDVELMFEGETRLFLRPGMELETTTGISISGSLFFGSTQYLERSLAHVVAQQGHRCDLVLLCNYVNGIDVSGATVLMQEALKRRAAGHRVAIWLREEHIQDAEVRQVLHRGFGGAGVIRRREYTVDLLSASFDAHFAKRCGRKDGCGLLRGLWHKFKAIQGGQ